MKSKLVVGGDAKTSSMLLVVAEESYVQSANVEVGRAFLRWE